MNCPKCGSPLTGLDFVCPNCGNPINNTPLIQQTLIQVKPE
ncbi:MAG: hypothetical protein IKF19_05345 [Bacilli bacterium]|nr:hypothetical protein [Bacilli bacterium]